MGPSDDQVLRINAINYLNMFGPDTYSLALPQNEVCKYLLKHGYIEWIPPTLGGVNFGITEKGRKAAKGHPFEMENP